MLDTIQQPHKKDIKLSSKEAAAYLQSKGVKYTSGSLAVLRCKGRGPRYSKVGGRRCYYHQEDLDLFLAGVAVETVDSKSTDRRS